MLPADLLERFRVLSLERVGRLETAWNRLVHVREDDDGIVQHMQREVHTLKGDAAVVGAREVLRLCQKLEDLLAVTQELHFEVSEDLEVVVTMAIQFLGMLLRVKVGAMTGLDLDGFVHQVDDVLRETQTLPVTQRRHRRASLHNQSDASLDRLTEPTRLRLATAATTVFLEYLSARGSSSRSRLRGVWTAMRDELARMQVTDLGSLLDRHLVSARDLAAGCGKRVAIDCELANLRVEPRVAEAVDIAVLHVIRNAIDHGIECPADRKRAGKPEQGSVRLTALHHDATIEIVIEDDGAGVDLAAVRAKASARGLVVDPTARTGPRASARSLDDNAALLDLVFEPGFSTRTSVTELSGRGVGLDAVRSALARVGGTATLATGPTGTRVTLTVPTPVRQLHAYHFIGPGGAVSLAVSARWSPTVETIARPDAIDPLHTIHLFGSRRQTSVEAPTVRDLSIRIRWGFLEVSLRAATEPRLVTAERICPTPDDHPVEVVTVDGQETLLLRPEHVPELAAAWRRRSGSAPLTLPISEPPAISHTE
jgi:two-component system, chemotaxis family, sensor kinase CheA